MNENKIESQYFIFNNSTALLYTSPKLSLVDSSINDTHIIEGPHANLFLKFSTPQTLYNVLLCGAAYYEKVIIDFLRLINNGILLSCQENETLVFKSPPFWDEAYIYHMLSRTTKGSKFLANEEQHSLFMSGVSTNKEIIRSPYRKGKIFTLSNYLTISQSNKDFSEVIYSRRTKRCFGISPISSTNFSWILGTTWGYTLSCTNRPFGLNTQLRTSPSCGGLQSIQVYALVLNVEGVPRGAYWYDPENHTLVLIDSDLTNSWLLEACAGQKWVIDASVFFVMTATVDMLMLKYNTNRLYKMLYVEAGHFSQTLQLCAEYTGNASFLFGAMNEQLLEEKLRISPNVEPILFITGLGELDKNSNFHQWINGVV